MEFWEGDGRRLFTIKREVSNIIVRVVVQWKVSLFRSLRKL
ncbi:unnamed protein product [Brassica rapa]|uniref:Uncharacterized protein n=2 Tax=Brassica TaxID=3705 RepID=A0A8D9H8V3_BRACM|nr:unnamed protein product [Brassica napus]CAG7894868.1 unnamed protein product [Brassica rapa]